MSGQRTDRRSPYSSPTNHPHARFRACCTSYSSCIQNYLVTGTQQSARSHKPRIIRPIRAGAGYRYLHCTMLRCQITMCNKPFALVCKYGSYDDPRHYVYSQYRVYTFLLRNTTHLRSPPSSHPRTQSSHKYYCIVTSSVPVATQLRSRSRDISAAAERLQ
jgi:hypothetical protein